MLHIHELISFLHHLSTSGPLHELVPLPEMLLLTAFHLADSIHHSELSSEVTSSRPGWDPSSYPIMASRMLAS